MLKWAYLCGLAAAAAPNNTFTFGNARITVHTPALLRLEWSANATFDDRPTLAFINRAVATCTFTASTSNGTLSLNTTALKLRYSGNGSSFSNDNLAISFMLRPGEWHTWTPAGPGTTQCGTLAGQDRVDCGVANPNATSCAAANCCFDPDVNGTNYDQHLTHCYRKTIGGTNNLLGSVSTMDCDLGLDQCITWYKAQMNQGLVSRDGWVLVDDSSNAALNSSDFTSSIPWRQERPWTTSYTDWYFFGHGHDYKSAVHDYTLVGGPVNLMDIQGYGIWHSYYHKYTGRPVPPVFSLCYDCSSICLPLSCILAPSLMCGPCLPFMPSSILQLRSTTRWWIRTRICRCRCTLLCWTWIGTVSFILLTKCARTLSSSRSLSDGDLLVADLALVPQPNLIFPAAIATAATGGIAICSRPRISSPPI